jgi:hypothetical protein
MEAPSHIFAEERFCRHWSVRAEKTLESLAENFIQIRSPTICNKLPNPFEQFVRQLYLNHGFHRSLLSKLTIIVDSPQPRYDKSIAEVESPKDSTGVPMRSSMET